ncbi:hypothetical protein ACFE04_020799 [Oxalis oulophora]
MEREREAYWIMRRREVWNYEESKLLTSFDNHSFPDKGISKLCLMNELATACFSLLDPSLDSFGSLFIKRMQSAQIESLRSSLILIFARMVHMSAPKVDNFINLLVSYLSKTVLPPSWVAFTDSERLIGEAVKNLAAVNLEKTIFDVKRFIGGKNKGRWADGVQIKKPIEVYAPKYAGICF